MRSIANITFSSDFGTFPIPSIAINFRHQSEDEQKKNNNKLSFPIVYFFSPSTNVKPKRNENFKNTRGNEANVQTKKEIEKEKKKLFQNVCWMCKMAIVVTISCLLHVCNKQFKLQMSHCENEQKNERKRIKLKTENYLDNRLYQLVSACVADIFRVHFDQMHSYYSILKSAKWKFILRKRSYLFFMRCKKFPIDIF